MGLTDAVIGNYAVPMSKIEIPKAAQTLIDDAHAEGMHVQVIHDEQSITVNIESQSGASGSATWMAGEYHDAAPSRLAFHTTPGRYGVRFYMGSVHLPYAQPGQQYPAANSVRKVRGYLGLTV